MTDDHDAPEPARLTVEEALQWRVDHGLLEHMPPAICPLAPHRGPQGPNEDLAQCFYCGMPTRAMRPWGETFGTHLPDCSLPIWHESYCEPGGDGHPEAPVIRG